MTNHDPSNPDTGEASERDKAIAQSEAEAELPLGEFDQLVRARVAEIISAASDPNLTVREAFERLREPLV